jgi:hypothetical protein
MRRTALALAALTAFPLAPALAAPKAEPLTTWVVERVSPDAREVTVRGGAGAGNHDYAFAAVASATVGKDGRFESADGGLFFGATTESGAVVRTPAGNVRCDGLPSGGTACTDGLAGSGIAFAIWWGDVTFNRVLVTIRGKDRTIDLGENGSPGWRIRRWTGAVRVVTSVDYASANGPLGSGAGAFGDAQSFGGPGGSVAIGHPPCQGVGYAAAGSGVVRLQGGPHEVVATCPADQVPPAAAAPGGTEWTLTGASAGVSDVPARLVVIERPQPRR